MNATTRVVALATHAALPTLTDDDRRLVPALAVRGVQARAAVWDDPQVDWTEYEAVVIRSCWDYHLRPAAFFAWVEQLESASVPLWNAPALLRWNAEKTYLRELAERGVRVVPTRWIEAGSVTALRDVLGETGWDHAVVKPAVSASAHETWQTSRASAGRHEARFKALVGRGRALVQPFVEIVAIEGEWSLLFFGGVFSHAMLKRARKGDFRVQEEYGGTAIPSDPGVRVIAQAGDALRAGPPATAQSLYARVDGCVVDGNFVVMEVELLEPVLYLAEHPDAPDRLAAALLDRLR